MAYPMNSGTEGNELAIKYARRYGYDIKGIPDFHAKIAIPYGAFLGRSLTATAAVYDPVRAARFGPFAPGFVHVAYNNLEELEKLFKEDPNICAYLMEPIQGEEGMIIPDQGYYKGVRELCDKYKVFLIMDEVQTGFGRTGKLMAHQYEDMKPDMLVLGKALSAGVIPVSAVVGKRDVMSLIGFGEHGGTFGGNPLAMVVSKRAVELLFEEGLIENSERLGKVMKERLEQIDSPLIKEVRGRGLWCALEMHEGNDTYALNRIMIKKGLLPKPTKKTIMRLAPALNIKEDVLLKGLDLFEEGLRTFEKSTK